MTNLIKTFILASFAFLYACNEETNNPSLPEVEPITSNRWKQEEIWKDRCQNDSQPIQGYVYVIFSNDKKVSSKIELFGEKYNCSDYSEELGSWYKANSKYFFVETGNADTSEVTISSDGKTLCFVSWQECFKKE